MKLIIFILGALGIFSAIIFYKKIAGKEVYDKKLSAWQLSIEKIFATKKAGQFKGQDKTGIPIIIEWQKTDVQDSEYAPIMRSVADVAVKSYLPVEMQFLKTYPDLVFTDDYFKQFEPFFKNGVDAVDWKLVEEKMASVIRSMYVTKLPENIVELFANDIYFVVTAKDGATKKLLGFVLFLIAPCHPQGSVWPGHLAIAPEEQNRGLGKLLMSSIFKIIPQMKRILINTRITNDAAFNAYQAWGFTQDHNPIENPNFKFNKEHWRPYMNYRTEQSDILQKLSETLVEVN